MPILQYRVDTQLARLLAEGYRSSEAALKELVNNAWEADAAPVQVALPAPETMPQRPTLIARDASVWNRGGPRPECPPIRGAALT
jgi:hypothetical protein